jgi:4a-hydroxytetrahydrobiopterin dehydratase
MTERINSRQFHESEGIQDWRVLYGRAVAHFATGSFATGVALVDAIGTLADAANHHPDVDLRYQGVTVRLATHEVGGLSTRDLELAREISAAARGLGVQADPSATQQVNITIDAMVRSDVMPFWRAVLGYRAEGDEDLVDPSGIGPAMWFQQMDAVRPQRNSIHVDIAVPHEQAAARVEAALAAGGVLITDAHAPSWWVLADAEGNEACIATWVGRWWEE